MPYSLSDTGAKNFWHERNNPRPEGFGGPRGRMARFSYLDKEGVRRVHREPNKLPRSAELVALLKGIPEGGK